MYLLDLVPDTVGARNQFRYQLRNRGTWRFHWPELLPTRTCFPASTRSWSDLPPSVKNSPSHLSFKYSYLKLFPRPTPCPLYYERPQREAIAHARLRMDCSPLNADLHNYLHIIESPDCFCNMQVEEDADHYLLVCPLYNNE